MESPSPLALTSHRRMTGGVTLQTAVARRTELTVMVMVFALLVQLLVEIAFIDPEAGDIQRFSQGEVAVLACLLCCSTQSFHPVRQLSQISSLPCPTRARYLLGPAHCAVF
jgi:hypothetical protein